MMRLSLTFVACMLFSSAIACSSGIMGKVLYFSSSEGNDNNCGSRSHPKKTLGSLSNEEKCNNTIRLKRGDVFFESVCDFKNCTVEAYGRGRMPILCGFKVLKCPEKWEYVSGNIWRIDLSDSLSFMGYNEKSAGVYNNIGCIYIPGTNTIIGHIVESKDLLLSSGDVFTTGKCSLRDLGKLDGKYVYLYYSENPCSLGSVCFSIGQFGVSALTNCTIRNIAIMGFRAHGMCQLERCIVDNCRIDVVGGAIQFEKCPWVRYGNGIEFWISDQDRGNSLVSNCTISRTFDCGATIQGASKQLGSAINIRFVNNKFIYCRQSFEHFLQSDVSDSNYINCCFRNNLAFMMGENQFNSPEVRDAVILSYELQDREIDISNNVFYGGNYYYGNRNPDGMNNNIVYSYEDQYIHNPHFRKDLEVLNAKNDSLGVAYKQRTGDDSKIIVLKRDSKQDRRIRKKILKKINYKKLVLNLGKLQ